MGPRRAWARGALCTLAALAAAALPASASGATTGPFLTGFSGPEYTSGDQSERGHWFDQTAAAAADLVRINVSWRDAVTGQPADPANPLDPAYDFGPYDAAVRDAAARGIEVMFTVTFAPNYAEGPGRPPGFNPGSWKPDPAAYGQFARAMASRYSGAFLGLPRVRYYQAWNEPNLATYLSPPWDGDNPVSPAHYRLMLNAFEQAVHTVNADNVVITGGTGPYGDPPGGFRIRPLEFWREVLCLEKQGGKLRGTSCPEKARFDVFAHHPINTSGGPTRRAVHPDDVSTNDFHKVRSLVRAAESEGTVDGGRHDLWATEIWLESNPPDTVRGQSLARHAEWNQQSLFLLWKQGASAVFNLYIRDYQYDPANPGGTTEAGLFFHDGGAKPAFTAWRFPFLVDRKGLAWGRSPQRGKVRIQRKRGNGWRTVARERARARAVFTKRLDEVRTGARFRAVVNGESSLTWRVQR